MTTNEPYPLQVISGDNQYTKVSVSYGFSAVDLNPAEITALLGIAPSRAYARGDEYVGHLDRFRVGLRKRACGLWGIDTDGAVHSSRLGDHLEYLVGLLGPKASAIKELLRRKDIYVGVWIRLESPCVVNGFALRADLLLVLARLCRDVNVSVISVQADSVQGPPAS